eukprot:3364957-Amphidinium_carterae.2
MRRQRAWEKRSVASCLCGQDTGHGAKLASPSLRLSSVFRLPTHPPQWHSHREPKREVTCRRSMHIAAHLLSRACESCLARMYGKRT